MFRHVVLMRWKEETTADQLSHMEAGLAGLPALVPEIRDYKFGADAGMSPGNFDFAIVADFDDVESYVVYRDHPDHVALINDRIKPLVAERVAVQHELEK